MIERELAEFGRRMGMPSLAFSAQGIAALDIENMGRLYLERNTENPLIPELLLYLVLPVPAYDRQAPRRILELCHYKHAHPMPLHGGMHAGQIVLLTRFPEQDVNAARIEMAALFLRSMMERVAA